MYTIKNTSSKIIHIGSTILMPDMTTTVNYTTAMTPAIQALAKRNMLEVIAPVVEYPKQEVALKQQVEQGGDGEEPGKAVEQGGDGEETGKTEEPGEDKAPAEKPKGTRRTTRQASDAKE